MGGLCVVYLCHLKVCDNVPVTSAEKARPNGRSMSTTHTPSGASVAISDTRVPAFPLCRVQDIGVISTYFPDCVVTALCHSSY